MLKTRTLVIVLAIVGMGAQTKADGVELSLSISAQATEAYLGEPLMIRVQVTNVSDHNVKVPVTWGAGYFSGTVTRQGGKSNKWSFRTMALLAYHHGQSGSALKLLIMTFSLDIGCAYRQYNEPWSFGRLQVTIRQSYWQSLIVEATTAWGDARPLNGTQYDGGHGERGAVPSR